MSNEKNPGWLGYTRDYVTTQFYRDYFINRYKDPVINQPGFFMESKAGFFFVAPVFFFWLGVQD